MSPFPISFFAKAPSLVTPTTPQSFFKLLALAFLLVFSFGTNYGQSDLTVSITDIKIDDDGSYDFLIPADIDTLVYPEITFTLQGADGGRARLERDLSSNIKFRGGGGAYVAFSFALGMGGNKLSPGGHLRFIVGNRGENCSDPFSCGGGGGGGTAILYRPPGGTVPTDNEPPSLGRTNEDDSFTNWTLLGLGGGGGGATVKETSQLGSSTGFEGGSGSDNITGVNGGINGSGTGEGQAIGGNQGTDGNDTNVANGGHGYLTAGREELPDDMTYGSRGGSGYGNGGAAKDNSSGGGGGGGFSGGGAGQNIGFGGGGGTYTSPSVLTSEIVRTNATRFPEDGFVCYRFVEDTSPGEASSASCPANLNVEITAGQPVTLTPADLDAGSTDPFGFPLTFEMCQTDEVNYFCRDSKTWDCGDIGRTQPWLLSVNNGYQTSYCAVVIRIIESRAAPICPFSGQVVLDLDNSCVKTYTAAELAPLNDVGCDGVFPDLQLVGDDGPISAPDFFTNGYTFGAGDHFVGYSTEGGACSYAIRVNPDPAAFAISCPANQTITLGANDCETTVSAASLALNYSGAGTISYEINPEVIVDRTEGTGQIPSFTFPRGRNFIDYAVEEPGGCTAQCQFRVTVNETSARAVTFACQDVSYPHTVDLDFRAAYLSGVVTAEDACGPSPVSLSQGFLTGCDQIGVPQLVRLRVGTGAFQQVCEFNLTLAALDFTPNCPTRQLLFDLREDIPRTLDPTFVGSWTANDEITPSLDFTSFDCSDVNNSYTVTLTLEDECGNSGSCSRIVAVRDGLVPTVTCQNITRPLDENGNFELSYADILASANDNCGAENLTYTLDQTLFTCSDRGNTMVRLTAEDATGSLGSCLATVTISDETDPELLCKDVTIELGQDGTYRLSVEDVIARATDNCSLGYQFGQRDFTCDDLAASPKTITMIGRDPSNNAGTCTSVVTITTPDCPCIGADGILVVDNPEDVALCEDMAVSGVQFVEGNLDLSGYTLTIENDGRIVNEREDGFTLGFGEGHLELLNVSDNFDELIEDFGLEIFAGDDLLFTRVERSSQPVEIDGFPSILRVLTVEESFSPALNGTRFHYLDVELNGLVEEELGIYLEQNGVWESVPILDRSTTENWVEFDLDFSQLTGPVRFTLVSSEALPLDLLSFAGQVQDKVNLLEWTTAREEGFSHFAVERSVQGVTWQEVGAVAGAGEGLESNAPYTFTDVTPLPQAFYRLRMVDLDGTLSFSPLVFLERENRGELLVFPNPVTNYLTASLPIAPDETADISLLDLSGNFLIQDKATSTTYEQHFDVAPGVYLLVVEAASGRWTRRVVVR